jgi:hypothetical protein
VTARVPPEVLGLLESSLGSFEKLELIRAGAAVPLADLRAALQLDADSMREVIEDLVSAQLIEVSGAPEFRVQLGPRAQQDDFRSLMALYAEDRVAVMATLASSAMRRIRSMAARTFADAFVLKRKRHDDG